MDIRLALERVIEKKYPIPNATKNITDKKWFTYKYIDKFFLSLKYIWIKI